MVITLASVQNVKDRCGVRANATILANAGSEIDRYIEDAEGVVVGLTNIDWVTNYSSVQASIKKMLSTCVSAWAAKEIINYDMNGFTTVSEAITMLNVNEKTFQDTLKQLKELETNIPRTPNT